MKYNIAIGSRDGKAVTEHFGGCQKFVIVTVDKESDTYSFTGFREIEPPCKNGDHSDDGLENAARALKDCRVVLVSRIGPTAQLILERHGIDVLEYYGLIDDAIKRIIRYYR
jgi:nitrogen fixation protein NifX